MKKMILIIFLLITFFNASVVYGTEGTEETIKEQEEALGISEFIKQSQKYTSEAFGEMDINELYKSAITGNINADGMLKRYI